MVAHSRKVNDRVIEASLIPVGTVTSRVVALITDRSPVVREAAARLWVWDVKLVEAALRRAKGEQVFITAATRTKNEGSKIAIITATLPKLTPLTRAAVLSDVTSELTLDTLTKWSTVGNLTSDIVAVITNPTAGGKLLTAHYNTTSNAVMTALLGNPKTPDSTVINLLSRAADRFTLTEYLTAVKVVFNRPRVTAKVQTAVKDNLYTLLNNHTPPMSIRNVNRTETVPFVTETTITVLEHRDVTEETATFWVSLVTSPLDKHSQYPVTVLVNSLSHGNPAANSVVLTALLNTKWNTRVAGANTDTLVNFILNDGKPAAVHDLALQVLTLKTNPTVNSIWALVPYPTVTVEILKQWYDTFSRHSYHSHIDADYDDETFQLPYRWLRVWGAAFAERIINLHAGAPAGAPAVSGEDFEYCVRQAGWLMLEKNYKPRVLLHELVTKCGHLLTTPKLAKIWVFPTPDNVWVGTQKSLIEASFFSPLQR
jgi:hypothetical protein